MLPMPTEKQRNNNEFQGGMMLFGRVESFDDIMLRLGFLTPSQAVVVRKEQEAIGGKFGDIALRLGFISEKQLAAVSSIQGGVEYYDLRNEGFDCDMARLLPAKEAQRHRALVIRCDKDRKCLVGMTEPDNLPLRDNIARILRRQSLRFVGIEYSAMVFAHARVYPELNFRDQVLSAADEILKEGVANHLASKALVPKLVSAMIWDSMSAGASDIHLVSSGDIFRVFYRISGKLTYRFAFGLNLYATVAAQIKQSAGIEPGDRLHFADGNMTFDTGNRVVNIRVSKLPTIPAQEGESLVLRILDRNRVALDLAALGFSERDAERLRAVCQKPYGMILCTGPTGSGKTTTLYSMLGTRSAFEANILTAENPVEYQIPGIRQVQINERAGITFASALRNFLRQDPDIILVGEIRDMETSQIACHAAITGHLLFSTLHTNDAVGAIPRLLEFGIDPNSLRSSLVCVIAQRLVRKLCRSCSFMRDIRPSERLIFEAAGIEPPDRVPAHNREGCPMCSGGFTSPTIIYEILILNDELREMIGARTTLKQLRDAAVAQGMTPIHQNGLNKVLQGITTIDEVVAVAGGNQ